VFSDAETLARQISGQAIGRNGHPVQIHLLDGLDDSGAAAAQQYVPRKLLMDLFMW